MSKSTYKDFVKSHRTIKSFIRHLYLYGCYNRDDFRDLFGISGRKYDNERRRIISCVDDTLVNKSFVDNSKYLSFKYDMFQSYENFLIETYCIKAFSGSYMNSFFLIQQILNSEGLVSKAEIDTILSEIVYDSGSMSTLDRRLQELEDMGLISSLKDKNKDLFKISEDFFEKFSNEEILSMFYAVQFYCDVGLIGVPGYFLKQTIKNYMKYERDYEFEEKQIYRFRHLMLSKICDDEIIQCALECIRSNRKMDIEYIGKSKKSVKKLNIIPLKIITEYQYGRQYLFSLDTKIGNVCLHRVDKIDKFKKSGVIKEEIDRDSYDIYIEKSWGATLLDKGKGLTKVEVDFRFEEQKEIYVLDRVNREMKWGSIEKLGEGHYLYSVEVSNPDELKPWIRSFHSYAKVRKSTKHTLSEAIENDWREALNNYGSV